ncbi:MAG: hypothetical protein HS108_01675 [Planctomycetes bacterium]|jgi:hypothetical protein|nr:hypothetical protein [Planctomycetota bacterium]
MRRIVFVLPLLLAACGGSPKRTDDRPQPDPQTQDPVWREDQKPAEPKQPTKPADPKPAEPKVEKQPTKPAEPKPAEPKVEKQPTKPAEPKPADPKVEKQPTKPAEPKPAEPKVEKQPDHPVGPVANKELLADEFIADVKARLSGLEDTKSFKRARQEFKHFQDKLARVAEEKKQPKPNPKNLEKAWAETIKAWYEARYSLLLFLHLHTPDKEFVTVFIHERAEVLALSDAQLRSAACRASQAAAEVSSEMSRELGRFQSDYLKNDLTCHNVFQDKQWQKTWEDEKKKWADAAEGRFDSREMQRFKD